MASWSPVIKHANGQANIGQAFSEYGVNSVAFIAGGWAGSLFEGVDAVIAATAVANSITGAGNSALYGGDVAIGAVKGATTSPFFAAMTAGIGGFICEIPAPRSWYGNSEGLFTLGYYLDYGNWGNVISAVSNPSVFMTAETYITSSGGVWYPENSYSYNEVNLHYLPAEGVGLGGSTNVRGNVNVYQGSDGKYYANVNASAKTGASTVGDVSFSGTVDVMSGRKVISSYNLNRFRGPSIGQTVWQDVGISVFGLPQSSNGNIYLRINVGYTFHVGQGSAVPIPAAGSHKIQIGYYFNAIAY